MAESLTLAVSENMGVQEFTSLDWVEDFEHENGNYQNECCCCHRMFRGHKRRVVCRLCGVPEKSFEKMAECT